MGIIARQSFYNVLSILFAFALGGLNTIVFYPNPVHGVLKFEEVIQEVVLLTLAGEVVEKWVNVQVIDFQEYKNGSYILKAKNGKYIQTDLLLKN